MMARAVFLDRDGTLIRDVGYPRDPELVELVPGAVSALGRIQKTGFALVIVSNQSGIGRGLVSEAEAERVHARFVALLGEHGIAVQGAYYCPHGPDEGCACRKPAIGLFRRAADELNLIVDRSYMVGDKPSDIAAGRNAGCRTLLLSADSQVSMTPDRPDLVSGDWVEIANWIIEDSRRS